MKIGAFALAALILPSAGHGQASNVPSGSPLGAADAGAAQAQAQAAIQARQQAAAQARVDAQRIAEAFEQPSAPVMVDEGRPRATASTFGQSRAEVPPARTAPSPYGGYYQIRTPWDRR